MSSMYDSPYGGSGSGYYGNSGASQSSPYRGSGGGDYGGSSSPTNRWESMLTSGSNSEYSKSGNSYAGKFDSNGYSSYGSGSGGLGYNDSSSYGYGGDGYGSRSSSNGARQSPFLGVGNMISSASRRDDTQTNRFTKHAGCNTKSQITSENFGGAPLNNDNGPKGRFAGKTSHSTLTLAHFGGGMDEPQYPNKGARSKSPMANRPMNQPMPQQYQQNMSRVSFSPKHSALPSMSASSHESEALNYITKEQAEKMIREIAELRIENQDLKSRIEYLQMRMGSN